MAGKRAEPVHRCRDHRRIRLRKRDGRVLDFTYDARNRVIEKTAPGSRTVCYGDDIRGLGGRMTAQYDADGNRTRVTHPDGARFDSVYDAADRLQYTNPTAAGGGGSWRMLTMAYDPLGRRTTMNPASSDITYQYDPVSRLQIQTQHFAGSVGDGQDTLGYNPASQITSEARTNDALVYAGAASVTTAYSVNGLNQYTAAGPAGLV